MGGLVDDLATMGVRRVHVLAWRDLDDADAGGSEVHADEFMRRWAQAGLDITHRTSAAPGLPAKSTRNGYSVVRRGNRYTVFPRTAASEIVRKMGSFDALVEIWNGVPWMTPVWCHKPRIAVLHHVHGPMWNETFPQPFAAIGKTLESRLAPPFYRRTQMVALSDGTRDEIRDLGFRDEQISCVRPGVDPFFVSGDERTATPTVLSVGRLAPGKRFPALLAAMAPVRAKIPDVQLVVVGEGPDRERMESWIVDNDAASWVTLAGRVSAEELLRYYQSSWLVTSASVAEGWGMTLTEAGACATPAVVTDVNGHRDSVHHGVTGLLTSLPELSNGIVTLLNDHEQRAQMGKAAQEFAESLSWNNTALELLTVLRDRVARRRQASSRG